MSRLNELIKIANHVVDKQAFIDASGAGGGGAPPGGDPAAMGMDPSMMGGGMPPGGDPAAMGMDPAAMGGGGAPPPAPGMDPMAIQQMVTQAVQQAMGGGAGGGAAGGGLKPKIDVNVALMQLSKMVARIADALGVQIPAHEMIATPQDLTAMAQQQSAGAPAAGAGGGGGSSIPPIQPIQGASVGAAGGGSDAGKQASNMSRVGDKAAALAVLLGK